MEELGTGAVELVAAGVELEGAASEVTSMVGVACGADAGSIVTTMRETARAEQAPNSRSVQSARALMDEYIDQLAALEPYLENWELKLAVASIVIGFLSVWFIFRAPKQAQAAKPAKAKAGKDSKQPQPQTDAAVPEPAAAAVAGAPQGKSLSALVKSQGKRKGPAVPAHPAFIRLFKSSGSCDVTCFAASSDGRVSLAAGGISQHVEP